MHGTDWFRRMIPGTVWQAGGTAGRQRHWAFRAPWMPSPSVPSFRGMCLAQAFVWARYATVFIGTGPASTLSFPPPKSVALEALFEGDGRVVDGHCQAVDETLDWIENRLLETRIHDRSTGKRPRVRAHGMAAATFRHHASRNHDPQIHTHCVIANMTRTPSARWGPVDPTSLRRNRNLIGAFYRNRLAAKLHDLGFMIVPTLIGRVPGFEIAGYDQTFLDEFSSRRREILQHLDRLGLPRTSRAAGLAALVTRRRKIDRRLDALRPEWRARAERLGLFRPRSLARPTAQERSPDPPLPDRSVTDIVWRAVEYLEGKAPVFSTAELTAIALGHAPGRHTPAMVVAGHHQTPARWSSPRGRAPRHGPRLHHAPGIDEAEKKIVSWATSAATPSRSPQEGISRSVRNPSMPPAGRRSIPLPSAGTR